MKKDTIVIDIETSNTFADVGRDNFRALNISVVGIYSYNRDAYETFEAHELDALGKLLAEAELIVGFAISRFDLPVMAKHYTFDLFSIPHIDILDEIELSSGKRISLQILSEHNLGYGKSGKGMDAPILFEQGKMEELKAYCLQDVKVTKDLYDLAKKQGYLMLPQKDGSEAIKVDLDWSQKLLYQRLF